MGGDEGLPPSQPSPATGAGHSEAGVKAEGNNNNDGAVVAGDAPAAKPVEEPAKDEIKFPEVPRTTLPLRLLDGGCPLIEAPLLCGHQPPLCSKRKTFPEFPFLPRSGFFLVVLYLVLFSSLEPIIVRRSAVQSTHGQRPERYATRGI